MIIVDLMRFFLLQALFARLNTKFLFLYFVYLCYSNFYDRSQSKLKNKIKKMLSSGENKPQLGIFLSPFHRLQKDLNTK